MSRENRTNFNQSFFNRIKEHPLLSIIFASVLLRVLVAFYMGNEVVELPGIFDPLEAMKEGAPLTTLPCVCWAVMDLHLVKCGGLLREQVSPQHIGHSRTLFISWESMEFLALTQ